MDFRSIANVLRIDQIPLVRAATWGYVPRKFNLVPKPSLLSRKAVNLKIEDVEACYTNYKFPNPIYGDLKIPRIFGSNRDERINLATQIEIDAKACAIFAYAGRYLNSRMLPIASTYHDKAIEILAAWAHANCTPKNAPTEWTDWVIGREEGDTPIVVASRMINFVLAAEQMQSKSGYLTEWFSKLAKYVDSYVPSVPNNHQSWKAAFLLTYGHVCNDAKYLNKGMAYFDQCMQVQFNADGDMPFELDRGEQAAYYSMMNLEAIGECMRISKIYADQIDKVSKYKYNETFVGGMDNFWECLKDPVSWHKRYQKKIGIKLETPENMDSWKWISLQNSFNPNGAHTMLVPFEV